VNYEAFINAGSVKTGSFTWSGTNENYMILYSNYTGNNGLVDNFEVSAFADNEEPVADADGPYDVPYGGTLNLDGSSSTDDSGIISYDWDIGSGALSVSTASATDSSITWQDLVDAGLSGGGAIALTVTDDGTPGLTGTDGTTFTVGAAPPSDIIPEPATMCALGLAVAGLGGYVRKRRGA
jgi:hypothetical protein